MAADTVKLPKGYVLEGDIEPPEGFVLEEPQAFGPTWEQADMMPYVLNLGMGGYKKIEERLSPGDRDQFRRVIETSDNPDEERKRIGNILYFSNLFNEPSDKISIYLDDILDATKFNPMTDGPKTIQQAAKDAYSRVEMGMAKSFWGKVKAAGEFITPSPKAMEKALFPALNKWEKEQGEKITEWSNMMLAGIETYYRENPGEAVRLPLQAGFVKTLKEYATNPAVLVQSLIESGPFMLEATVGTVVAGPVGGVAMISQDVFGTTYADARAEGTEPLPALAQATLTGLGEGAIEQWTMSRKLGLFKNFRKMVAQGLSKILWEGTKAFFRGTAEEGTQEFNRNFWQWVFTDRSQAWFENTRQAMGAGGIMETVMAGGFMAAGIVNTPVDRGEQLKRVERIRTSIDGNPMFSEEHRAELSELLDKVTQEINEGVYELTEEELNTRQREIVKDTFPDMVKEVPEVVEKPPVRPVEAITAERPPTVAPKLVAGKKELEGLIDSLSRKYDMGLDPQRTPQETMGFDLEKEAPYFIVGTKDAAAEETLAVMFHEIGHLVPGEIEAFMPLGPKVSKELTAWQEGIELAREAGFNLTPELIKKVNPAYSKHIKHLTFQEALAPPTPAEPTVEKPEIVLSAKEGDIVIDPKTELGLGKRTRAGSFSKVEGWADKRKLGPPGKATNKVGAFLKRFALTVPEFTIDPVFTIDKEGFMVYQDGGKFRFKPELFGIEQKLEPGQKIRLDLESYGIKVAPKKKLTKAEALPFVRKPAEIIKAPKELLGGVPVKPPGLTKAEVVHLGKREQTALRAAQAKGLQVGYKKGVAETITTARRSLDAFRMKEKIGEKARIDAANIVLTYVPKEKQGDYIRRVLQAKTQDRITKLTEAIDKYLDKAEKRQAIRDFKKFVKDTKKKYRRGEVAFGKLPAKLTKKLIAALDEFDLAKISEKKKETLESRLEFVTRISGELAKGFEQLNEGLDKDATDLLMMGTRRIEELKRLSQTHIGEIDTDQIKYIQASLEHLIKINELKGQSKERRRIEKLRTDINNARQEVMPAKEKVAELTGVLGAIKWLGVEGQSTIRTLVGLATGKDNAATSHLLVNELNAANNKRKETYKSFIMYFRESVEKKQIKWSDINDLDNLTEITIGGKKIRIDYDNLLSIYAHTQAEGNLRRLLKTKGLNITVYAKDENGIFTKKNIYRVGKPTLAELRALTDLIPNIHKKLLDVYFKANWDKQAPAINETSMAYQNYELARQEKYYHVSREVERAVEGRKADLSISLEQQSRALPRTGGTARINIRPFTIEVMENMQWSAAYHAMMIPMENARTLTANTKWREAMKKAGQQKALNEITTMLRRSQGLISDQSVVELTASRLLGTVGKSILSLRFSGALVQTASVPAAIEFIEKEYLAQVDIPKPSDIKHLKEISPVLWIRWEAKQFDYALGMVGAQNAFETLLFDHRALTDKFLFPYTAGDEIAIVKLFKAAEKQIEAKTKLKRGTDEFQKASLDLLYEAMTTQPQWDMIHRSPLTSDPSVLARSISMFMSARNAQYNVLVRSIDNYRKGRITKTQLSERLAGVGMANLLVSLARHTFKIVVKAGAITALVAMGIRKPPDDEEIKKEVERLAKKIPLETVFNLVGLNALGSLFVSMGYAALKTRKYGWQTGRYSDIRTGNMLADLTLDLMQMGIDFTLFTDQIISGEKYERGKNKNRYKWEITGLRLIDDITLLIAYRFGLPYEGLKSDIVWPVQLALPK